MRKITIDELRLVYDSEVFLGAQRTILWPFGSQSRTYWFLLPFYQQTRDPNLARCDAYPAPSLHSRLQRQESCWIIHCSTHPDIAHADVLYQHSILTHRQPRSAVISSPHPCARLGHPQWADSSLYSGATLERETKREKKLSLDVARVASTPFHADLAP